MPPLGTLLGFLDFRGPGWVWRRLKGVCYRRVMCNGAWTVKRRGIILLLSLYFSLSRFNSLLKSLTPINRSNVSPADHSPKTTVDHHYPLPLSSHHTPHTFPLRLVLRPLRDHPLPLTHEQQRRRRHDHSGGQRRPPHHAGNTNNEGVD